MYGVTFTIRDARALRIDRLPRGWMGLGKKFTDCRNFQFGVQMFGYNPQNSFPTVGDLFRFSRRHVRRAVPNREYL